MYCIIQYIHNFEEIMAENFPPSNTDGIRCLLQAIDDDDFVQAFPTATVVLKIQLQYRVLRMYCKILVF
jgi:hypothetical protein